MYRTRRKKLGNNTEKAQFLSACGHAQAGIVPLQPSTTNCRSLERGNPAYFHIFLLSRRAIKTRLTEDIKKKLKNFPKNRNFSNKYSIL